MRKYNKTYKITSSKLVILSANNHYPSQDRKINAEVLNAGYYPVTYRQVALNFLKNQNKN